MKLDKLKKIKSKSLRRVGRGPGSGRGKTSGRGTKGQNARGSLSVSHSHYEGGQRPIFKRLPYRRGKGNPKISLKPLAVNIELLNKLNKNQTVDIEELIKANIVDKIEANKYGVKILGKGKINIPLTIKVPISKSAAEKITKLGGKIQV